MAKIRSRDTGIELPLRRALWRRGMRYRVHYDVVVGRPDIVFTRAKVAIFCDSSFWHGRDEERTRRIRSNAEYWQARIERNVGRDQEVNSRLAREGWTVLRFWDDELKNDLEGCVQRVARAVEGRLARSKPRQGLRERLFAGKSMEHEH